MRAYVTYGNNGGKLSLSTSNLFLVSLSKNYYVLNRFTPDANRTKVDYFEKVRSNP